MTAIAAGKNPPADLQNAAPLFNGQSALDRLPSGHVADLYVLRQYLDAQRGGLS